MLDVFFCKYCEQIVIVSRKKQRFNPVEQPCPSEQTDFLTFLRHTPYQQPLPPLNFSYSTHKLWN